MTSRLPPPFPKRTVPISPPAPPPAMTVCPHFLSSSSNLLLTLTASTTPRPLHPTLLLPPLPRPDVSPFVLALEPRDSLTVTFASDVTLTPIQGLAMTPENKSQVVAAVAANAAAGKIDLLESLMSCLNRSSHVVVALGNSKPNLGVTDTNLILSAIQNLLHGDPRDPKVRIDVLGASNELSRGLADLTGGEVFETVEDMVASEGKRE